MTSEPASTPRRRPPTIDLTATEVKTEGAAADTANGGNGPNDASARGWSLPGSLQHHLVGAVAGALLMALIVGGLWLAGVVPSHEAAPVVLTGNPNVDDIRAQLAKIQSEIQARQADPALTPRLAAIEAQAKVLGDSFAALTRRIDEVAVTARSALEHADAASQAAKAAAQNAVQRGDVDALADRIAGLERTIKSLSDETARRTSSADDRVARSAVAAEALRAVVERGAPFQAELATMKSLGADRDAIAQLEPFAADGVPAAAALAHELAQLTPTLQSASGAPPSSGGSFIDRLEDHARHLVRITPVDDPTSDDPGAVIARLDADAARADIAAALSDIARLPESAKPLAASWVKKAEARNAALAAGRRIAAAALAGLGGANTQ